MTLTLNYYGAGDRTRTGDVLLGRQSLYQLSYSRMLRICATLVIVTLPRLKPWASRRSELRAGCPPELPG